MTHTIYSMKHMKKIMTLLLSLTLIIGSTFTVAAEDEVEGTREETVYGLLNSDGTTRRVIVTEHVQKDKHLETITINSDLTDVSLLMKDVDIIKKDEVISFTTEESDIYYRGEMDKELPITTKITYVLDGQAMMARDLVGKSGHLVMTISQTNHEKRSIEVNGVVEEVFLPFETAVVMNMDNEYFENVEVSSGKLLDDGSMKVLTAVLTPGFEESLGEFESELITDEVVIEADVTEVKLSSIYMTTVCKLPNIDISKYLEEFSDIEGKIEEFTGASEELVAGSQGLNEGIETYFGKQSEAFDSFDLYLENDETILTSIVSFNNSMVDFNSGLQLYLAGVTELVTGVGSLSEVSPSLVAGMANFELSLSQVLPSNEQTAGLYEAFNQLEEGIVALDAGIQQVNTGGILLAEKTPVIAAGSIGLAEAAGQLSGGATLLIEKTEPLIQGLMALEEASKDVVTGADQLEDGVVQFKEEGVDTLVEQVESSLEKIRYFELKYREMVQLVDEYSSFTQHADNLDSSVTFIMKTESELGQE